MGDSIKTSRWVVAAMVVVVGLLTLNWVVAVARFQVNLLFWDQWNFLEPMFDEQGWWSLFNWQHGPHRQGVAFVLTSWVLGLCDWDTRWESLWIVSVMVAATVALLMWKHRLTGKLGWSDLWIPLAALGMRQWENVLLVPNASHSTFPLLLLAVAVTLARASPSILGWWGLGMVGFFALFTGFGIFVWGALLWWGVLRLIAAGRGRTRWDHQWGMLLMMGLLALALVVFLQGYELNPSSEGVTFPHWPLWDYPKFVMVMLASRMELTGQSPWVYGWGAVMLIAGLLVWADTTRRVAGESQPRAGDVAATLLLTTGLGFAFFAAAGRVHLGMVAAEVPRYTPLLVSFWLGLLAWSVARENRGWIWGAAGLGWIMALLPWADLPDREYRDWPGTLGMGSATRVAVHQSQGHKIHWLQIWEKSGHDWEAATQQVPPGLHRLAGPVRIGEKIEFLRQRELSFWVDHDERGAWLPWWSPLGVQRFVGWGGEGRQWMGDRADWLVDGLAPGFLNLKALWAKPELGEAPSIEVRWDGRSAILTHNEIVSGVSIPLIDTPELLTLISLDGTVPMAPPENLTPVSFVIEDPYVSTEPNFPVRWWGADGSGLWDDSEHSAIEGLWNWEHESGGAFVWSKREVVLDSRARLDRFWNIAIESRYEPVSEGPVELEWNGQRITVPWTEGGLRFSVPLPGAQKHQVRLINPAGAASPRDRGESGDGRQLALRLTTIEFAAEAAFPVLDISHAP